MLHLAGLATASKAPTAASSQQPAQQQQQLTIWLTWLSDSEETERLSASVSSSSCDASLTSSLREVTRGSPAVACCRQAESLWAWQGGGSSSAHHRDAWP